MKRARFTDEQIVRVLREADQYPVAETAKTWNLRCYYLRLAQAFWNDGESGSQKIKESGNRK